MKLISAVAILTAPLLLMGCGQRYETEAECQLEELKELGEQVEGGREVVGSYCADYFAQIEEEQEAQNSRDAGVQLALEPEWEEVFRKEKGVRNIEWVDISSISQESGSFRSAWIRSAESEADKEEGTFRLRLVSFDCANRSIKVDSTSEYIEDEFQVDRADNSGWDIVLPGSNGAAIYNFVCSYEIED